jgi:hypothetical protein
MVDSLEEDDFGLSETAFADGVEAFLLGQVEMMARYEIGLRDPAFRKELDRQIADFYPLGSRSS